MVWILPKLSNYQQVAPLVRTGGSRHTGLAAPPHRNIHLQWPRTGEEAKQISDQQLRWLLEGLNPEQPKAVQKWLPHKSGNAENP